MPLTGEEPLLGKVLVPGILFGFTLIATLIHDGPGEFLTFIGPLALCLGLLFILAFAWWAGDWDIVQRRKHERALRQRHICIHCGYDLRASPDRCPECGRRVDEPTSRP